MLIIIPARYASTRLPGKPLEKIGKKTIIEHCVDRVLEAGLKPYVATDDQRIADVVPDYAVMTGPQPTGTDRVAEAAEIIDPEGKHEFVINYQGDMPFLSHSDLSSFIASAEHNSYDVCTAMNDFDFVETGLNFGFARQSTIRHVGLYAYSRQSLRQFYSLPQTESEKKNNLEQLRWPSSWKVFKVYFHCAPFEINWPDELEAAKQIAKCLS